MWWGSLWLQTTNVHDSRDRRVADSLLTHGTIQDHPILTNIFAFVIILFSYIYIYIILYIYKTYGYMILTNDIIYHINQST